MKKKLPAITSREYKIVLDAARFFADDETGVIKKAQLFWTDLLTIIQPVLKDVEGSPDTIKTKRTITFYDTPDRTLFGHHYILRERTSLFNGKRELTLKCRHPDRYIVQGRDMHARNLRNAAIKFEEDIKAPFLQLYSFSSGGSPGKNDKLKILKEVTRHFPGLSAEFDRSTNNQMIKQVHDETIVEIVITGGSLELGSSQGETAECALIAWYGSAGFVDEPLIVEFSFRYGSKKARYARETAQNAFDIFELIQKNMTSWLGQKGATKTGLVFASVS